MNSLIPIRRHGGAPVVAIFVNGAGWALHGSHWAQGAPFTKFDAMMTKDEIVLSEELWREVFYPASKGGRAIAQMRERNSARHGYDSS